MKKILILVLTLSFVFGLCACGGGQTGAGKKPDAFMVGYGNTVLTPTMAHGPLMSNCYSGYSEPGGIIEKVIDDLPCTCVALTDTEGNTVLLYSLETLKAFPAITMHIPAISEATGVPVENILISTTHNHHSPNVHATANCSGLYIEYLGVQMVKAAKLALEDQKPAKAYATDAQLEGYNFCRHYIMNDGSYCTTTEWPNMINRGLKPVSHVVEADNQLQLVKFVREGGKDIVMLNWQAHPYTATDYLNVISATEQMRKIFEAKDQLLIHFNGASGDVGYNSRIEEENKFADWRETYTSLAEEAIKLDSAYKEIQLGKVAVLSQNVEETVVTIWGVSFGDVAVLFAPCEMFNNTGMDIKKDSPFQVTMIATNAMDDFGYIPTAETFPYGGYEVLSCYDGIGLGTAEKMRDAFVDMLPKLVTGE